MEFSTPVPVPEKGMKFYGIFIPVPVTGNGTSKSGKVVVLKYTSPYCATNTPKADVTPWCNNWDGLDQLLPAFLFFNIILRQICEIHCICRHLYNGAKILGGGRGGGS